MKNEYKVKIGNVEYLCINGVNAVAGDMVAYEWNPNNEIKEVVMVTQHLLTTHSGCGAPECYHKIINRL